MVRCLGWRSSSSGPEPGRTAGRRRPARRDRARARSTPPRRPGPRAGRARQRRRAGHGRSPSAGGAPSACRRGAAPAPSTASSGTPSASRSAASARRGPAASRSSVLIGGERGARRRPVALQRLHQDDQARTRRSRAGAPARATACIRSAARNSASASSSRPCPSRKKARAIKEDGLRSRAPPPAARTLDRGRATARPRRVDRATPARPRPLRPRARGCDRLPNRGLGDRHRLLAQPQPDVRSSSARTATTRGGRGSRPPGRAGRCGARAQAPPPGRGGRRPAQRPQLGDAEVHEGRGARWSLLGPVRPPSARRTTRRRIARRAARSPRWHASQSLALASRRSKSRRRASGTVAASRSATAMSVAASSRGRRRGGRWRTRAPARRPRRACAPERRPAARAASPCGRRRRG